MLSQLIHYFINKFLIFLLNSLSCVTVILNPKVYFFLIKILDYSIKSILLLYF